MVSCLMLGPECKIQREEVEIPAIQGRRDRRRIQNPLAHINSDSQFLNALYFLLSCQLGIFPKRTLLCLFYLMKFLLFATLCPLCLSYLSNRPPCKSCMGDLRANSQFPIDFNFHVLRNVTITYKCFICGWIAFLPIRLFAICYHLRCVFSSHCVPG